MTTPDTLTIRVNAHQFASAIRYVALAAAKDDARPVLAGINLRIAGNMLDIAAADGFRLHVAYVQLPSFNTGLPAADAPRNVVIDANALLTWAKAQKPPAAIRGTGKDRKTIYGYQSDYTILALSATSASIDGTDLERTISGGTGRYKVADRIAPAVIDGTFPDYRHIIPATDEAHRFRFNATDLHAAAKPYLRSKRDDAKLGSPRAVIYTNTSESFPRIAAVGFEMPDRAVGNGETTAFAHVEWFGSERATTTLASVLNTNYLHDALTGVDHGATFQTASTNTAVRLDLWQTQYGYSTQFCAVIMPLVLDGLGHPGIAASNHRDLNAPDANAAPQSAASAEKDTDPMPAPEPATVPHASHPCSECRADLHADNVSAEVSTMCATCYQRIDAEATAIVADAERAARILPNDGNTAYRDHAREHAAAMARAASYANTATVAHSLHAESRPRIVTVCDECGTEVDDTNASVDALLCIGCYHVAAVAKERANIAATTDYDDQHPVCGSCGCGPCACEQPPALVPPCPVCGAALEPGDRFCPMCGARIDLKEAAQERQVSAANPPREHRCKTCIATNHTGELCAACDALERTIAKRAARAAALAAQVAPDPEPADVLPYSGAQDLSAKYSQGNVLRILAACPTATDVRGFHQWQEAGRAVMKGEKGILIYTPAGTRTNDDGTERTMVRKAYVWDIAQTEPIAAFQARQDARKAEKQSAKAAPRAHFCYTCHKAISADTMIRSADGVFCTAHAPVTIRPVAPQPQPAMRAADI